jgi:hypothetical protein
MFKLAIAGALVLALSGCALPVLAPMEAVVAREAGYDSYFEKGLDYVAEQLGCTLPRDPVTGDC